MSAEPMAGVHPGELAEWAWLTEQLEEWLLHTSPDATDWTRFFRRGPALAETISMLGDMAVRMRRLARAAEASR